jgi:hypothetical protein
VSEQLGDEVYTAADMPTNPIAFRVGDVWHPEYFPEFPYQLPENSRISKSAQQSDGRDFFDESKPFRSQDDCELFMRDHLKTFIGTPKPKK